LDTSSSIGRIASTTDRGETKRRRRRTTTTPNVFFIIIIIIIIIISLKARISGISVDVACVREKTRGGVSQSLSLSLSLSCRREKRRLERRAQKNLLFLRDLD
tara:strand:- start:864 stop:1172 length:309 start_codon:yes stop_codon:yes gene_type:complete